MKCNPTTGSPCLTMLVSNIYVSFLRLISSNFLNLRVIWVKKGWASMKSRISLYLASCSACMNRWVNFLHTRTQNHKRFLNLSILIELIIRTKKTFKNLVKANSLYATYNLFTWWRWTTDLSTQNVCLIEKNDNNYSGVIYSYVYLHVIRIFDTSK